MDAIGRVYDEWFKAGYLRELTDHFKVLWLMPTNLQHLFLAKKKVTTMADFKGLNLRAVSGLAGKVITALGASGVSMPVEKPIWLCRQELSRARLRALTT